MIKIGIVTGEASGDILGAALIKALREHFPELQAEGVAGPLLKAQGCKALYDIKSLSMMGFVEPIKHLPRLFKMRKDLFQHFTKPENRPDIFIGIDSPDFNLGLEQKLKDENIPVIHYVSPSVWAWRKKRIFKIAKATDMVLTLFPFEKRFYDEHQVPATFVGHPLADQIPLEPDQLAARKALNLNPDKIIVALLPGSRKSEIQHLGNIFSETAFLLKQQNPNIEFITSSVNSEREKQFKEAITKDIPLHFYQERSHEVLAASDVVIVTSGTATLETMLFKKPMLIAYRTNYLTYKFATYVLNIKYIGLPNLLENELIVPEFIQDDANPTKLAEGVMHYLNHPEKIKNLKQRFLDIHKRLRCNASHQAAESVKMLISSK